MLYIEHEDKNKNAPRRAKLQNKFLELIFLLNLSKNFQTWYY